MEAVRTWTDDLKRLGEWTAGVGQAFLIADGIDMYTGHRGQAHDSVMSFDDHTLISDRKGAGDPYLGVSGKGEFDWNQPGLPGNPDWIRRLKGGDEAATWADAIGESIKDLSKAKGLSFTMALSQSSDTVVITPTRIVEITATGEITATLSVSAADISAIANKIGDASTALTFLAAFGEQWQHDRGLPPGSRLDRSALRGGAVGFGAWLGMARGATIGAEACGLPCGVAGGLVGAMVGAWAGSKVASPLLQDDPKKELKAVRRAILDAKSDPAADAAIKLDANQMARAHLANDPGLLSHLNKIAPNDTALRQVAHPSTTPTAEPPATSPSPPPTAAPPPHPSNDTPPATTTTTSSGH
jgi:hypothetical protein